MSVKVRQYAGVAFHDPVVCEDEGHHDDCRIVVMIGDDYKHHVDASDITPVDPENYCSGCGQIGCGWGA